MWLCRAASTVSCWPRARLAAYAGWGGARGPPRPLAAINCWASVICRRSVFRRLGQQLPGFAGDFVTTEDGTGIVHMAPAYGEDDKATTDTVGIVPVTPVDSKGRFDATVPTIGGCTFSRPTADHPRP